MSTRRVILVVLATLVIFAAGVMTGGLLVRQTTRSVAPPPAHQMFPARFEALRRVTDQLQGLTPDQRAQIDRIIRDGRERIADFFVLFEPDIQDVFRQMREDIRGQLTPEQRQRMEELMRQRPRRPEPPFQARKGLRGDSTN
ncbi:MAG TPA: hypothetical protein VNU68_34055 [Verrucomicrobiae bacterium]|nr:hypothetical protein [Verrucomicrobiae bacterium]